MKKILAFFLLGLVTQTVFAAEPLVSVLTVEKVEHSAGKLRFAPADNTKPGDILAYGLDYENQSGRALNRLVFTLPIPAGTELSSEPQGSPLEQASLDGKTFAPVPLKRQVLGTDGNKHSELVPLSAYRVVKWNQAELRAGEHAHFVIYTKVRNSQKLKLD